MIEQLDNNEQILLMYLADELPPDDRIEVEQMLARDATLRADLEKLQATQQTVVEGLGLLDASSPLPINGAAAARQVSRHVRRWLAQPAADAATAAAQRRRRSWGWALPAAAAAAILLAVGLWVSRHWPGASQNNGQQYVKADGKAPTEPDASQGDTELPGPPNLPQLESPYSLLVESFGISPMLDENEPVLISSASASPEDGAPQDDLSQYLLRSDATQ